MILSVFCHEKQVCCFETSRVETLPIKGDLIEIGGNKYRVLQRLFKYEEYSSMERRQGARGFNTKIVLITNQRE